MWKYFFLNHLAFRRILSSQKGLSLGVAIEGAYILYCIALTLPFAFVLAAFLSRVTTLSVESQWSMLGDWLGMWFVLIAFSFIFHSVLMLVPEERIEKWFGMSEAKKDR